MIFDILAIKSYPMDKFFGTGNDEDGSITDVLTGKDSLKVEHQVAVPWELFLAFAAVSLVLMLARRALA